MNTTEALQTNGEELLVGGLSECMEEPTTESATEHTMGGHQQEATNQEEKDPKRAARLTESDFWGRVN